MAVSISYLEYVLEQLSGVAGVTSRRMFGAIGLSCEGIFFGLIDDDALYFKVDDSNRPDYEARGMGRFRPYRDKPAVSMSYYEVPAEVLEDSDELAAWAGRSVAVAAAATKRKRTPGGKRRARSA